MQKKIFTSQGEICIIVLFFYSLTFPSGHRDEHDGERMSHISLEINQVQESTNKYSAGLATIDVSPRGGEYSPS